MKSKVIHQISTISEYHKVMGLSKPLHPSISIVSNEEASLPCKTQMSFAFNFYSIVLDRNFQGKMKYGQQQSDFDEGVLFTMAPGQVFKVETDDHNIINRSGWVLLIHPDFLWNTALAKNIKQYEFFDYSVNEALFLSDREERVIEEILKQITHELETNIDKFSDSVIMAQLELLLTYTNRFYQRQFITRKVNSHSILQEAEKLLDGYINSGKLATEGMITVIQLAATLNISPNYLSSLLKVLTGQNAQQFIQNKIIDYAKTKLSTTTLSVSEIAYELGFEYPQSFSRLFKAKTSQSPLEFRKAFY